MMISPVKALFFMLSMMSVEMIFASPMNEPMEASVSSKKTSMRSNNGLESQRVSVMSTIRSRLGDIGSKISSGYEVGTSSFSRSCNNVRMINDIQLEEAIELHPMLLQEGKELYETLGAMQADALYEAAFLARSYYRKDKRDSIRAIIEKGYSKPLGMVNLVSYIFSLRGILDYSESLNVYKNRLEKHLNALTDFEEAGMINEIMDVLRSVEDVNAWIQEANELSNNIKGSNNPAYMLACHKTIKKSLGQAKNIREKLDFINDQENMSTDA